MLRHGRIPGSRHLRCRGGRSGAGERLTLVAATPGSWDGHSDYDAVHMGGAGPVARCVRIPDRPVVPEHHLNRRPSRPGSGIVFESSTSCIETTPDVANTLAESAFRYISRRLDTRQPDLGSGAARRGGSSPSSCTVFGAFPFRGSRSASPPPRGSEIRGARPAMPDACVGTPIIDGPRGS